ncbi:MAG: thioredoxin domain-containing protein [Burkholderiales bacterium]|nr:thioredoxin domain-containing protein [Burkholderiales bacterium]
MSRKNKPSPAPVPTPAPAAPAAAPIGGAGRRRLFIGAGAVLVLGFGAATVAYRRQQDSAAAQAAQKNQPALVGAHAPRIGPREAKVQLVEFLDPACETCAAFYPHVKRLMAAHPGRIQLSLRHVPLHQGSDLVVRILEASREQGLYLSTLEGLYAAQRQWVVQHRVQPDAVWQVVQGLGLDLERLRFEMTSPAIAERMAQDMADARTLGVSKTPEFFANGRPMPRFGLEELQTLVDEEVRRAYP